MNSLTRILLWCYVFTLSWDTVSLPFVGSMSRACGLAVLGIATFATLLQGRLRKPDVVLAFAAAFSGWSVLSLLWTISYPDTVVRGVTYVQLLVSAWLIRQFVRTREQVELMLAAFCCGAFVPLASLTYNFMTGVEIGEGSGRYSGTNQNANELGIFLMIGLPMAWHLMVNRRDITRFIGGAYFAIAPVALLLTGTRGGVLAGLVALGIVPLTSPRLSLKSYALIAAFLISAVTLAISIVPAATWDRLMSIPTELTGGGRLSGRIDIWKAGLTVYPEHPFVGVGAGAYTAAIEPHRPSRAIGSHNTALGLLVEEGLVGLTLFVGILIACARTIVRSPPPYKALWGVLILTWFVGAMDGNSEYWKVTWALFGFVSAQSGLITNAMQSSRLNATIAAKSQTRLILQPASLARAQTMHVRR